MLTPHALQHSACFWQRARHATEAPLHAAGGPPLPPGISGIAALNSSLGGGVNPNLVNPNVAPVVDPSTVPFQEGWVKIRGIPPGVGKKELCVFFGASSLSSRPVLATGPPQPRHLVSPSEGFTVDHDFQQYHSKLHTLSPVCDACLFCCEDAQSSLAPACCRMVSRLAGLPDLA